MSITSYERVGKSLDLLREGLRPFVERELSARYGKYWITKVTEGWQHDLNWPKSADLPNLDAAALLHIMWDQWNDVFRNTLSQAERSLVSELRDVRNKWAHQTILSTDEAYRALDSAVRLLTAISAPQANEIEKMKRELLPLLLDEQEVGDKQQEAAEKEHQINTTQNKRPVEEKAQRSVEERTQLAVTDNALRAEERQETGEIPVSRALKAPSGALIRRWTLREDNHSHYHGVMSIHESPLFLELSWRQTATDPVQQVGTFRLDLPGLLQGGYIRWEPVNSYGPEVRLRIVRAEDGKFYVQVNQDGPRILLG